MRSEYLWEKMFRTLILLLAAFSFANASQKPLNLEFPSLNKKAAIFDDAFDSFVEGLLQALHIPGLSIAVIQPGNWSSKATNETMWFTGSTTKAFTAALAAILAEERPNDLTLQTPVHELLPDEFVLKDSYSTNHITLEDALSHRTGLPRHDFSIAGQNSSLSQLVQSLRHLPLTAEPRSVFQYCNLMFSMVSHLLEKLTGRKLAINLKQRFWEPLGMHSTFFSLAEARDHAKATNTHLARGYYWVRDESSSYLSNQEHGYYIPDPYLDMEPLAAGAGATISTVNDYAKWVSCLIHASKDSGIETQDVLPASPISRSIYRQVLTPRTLIQRVGNISVEPWIRPTTYALGWMTGEFFGRPIVAHGGGLPGFGADIYMLPDTGHAVITMANTVGTSNVAGATLAVVILRHLAGTEEATTQSLATFIEQWTWKHDRPSFVDTKHKERLADILANEQVAETSSRAVHNYAGVYSHPAYGELNVTAEATSEDSLLLVPLDRLLVWKMHLTRSEASHSFFTFKEYFPHGPYMADPVPGLDISCSQIARKGSNDKCKQEVFYEEGFAGLVSFEIGPTGSVERMGVELDIEMWFATQAPESVRKGHDGWRNTMIWFKKLA